MNCMTYNIVKNEVKCWFMYIFVRNQDLYGQYLRGY